MTHKPSKRMGRPTKAPVAGERVSLGLRVTAAVKSRLERAAVKSGRSLSQEAEWRLESSLESDRNLILRQGATWSPVLFRGSEMLVYVGDEEVVALQIHPDDRRRMLDYFREQYPEEEREYLDEEVEEAGERHLEMLREIEKGK
jgi:hypothetical protein